MTLHDAMLEALASEGRALSASALAAAVNRLGNYSRGDGAPIPASQISARAKNYPHLFARSDRMIGLRTEQSKSDKPRIFPFAALPGLAFLLREQRERTAVLERSESRVIPWVFHLNGGRLVSFRTGWRNAVKRAGLQWLTPHDMRRSAARNLVRAGVPEKVVMDLCGWKTRAMFDRYNITSARDLVKGVERLGAYLSDSGSLRAESMK